MLIECLFSLSVDGKVVDVDEWSSLLGIQALECCKCGDLIPFNNSKSKSRSSYWTVGIKKTESDSVNEQVKSVLDLLHPKKDEIFELIEKHQLESGLAVFIWLDQNEEDEIDDLDMYLDSDNIQKLGDLKGDFAIKVYDC